MRTPDGSTTSRQPAASSSQRTPGAVSPSRTVSNDGTVRELTGTVQPRTVPVATPGTGVVVEYVDRYVYVDGSMTTATVFEMTFAWGDATPAPIFTLNSGAVIAEVNVWMLDEFDASGSTITIGKDTDRDDLMDTTEIDPTIKSSFSTRPGKEYLVGEVVNLYIVPGGGCTQGRGVLSVYII